MLSFGPSGWLSSKARSTAADAATDASATELVFCFGSNGVAQLRVRCQNKDITAQAAYMADASRCFAGMSKRWGGAVASVVKCPGRICHGSVVRLTEDELQLLDGFEGCQYDDPYGPGGVYRRERCFVCLLDGGEPQPALMYVKNDLTWRGPPSTAYLDACLANLLACWPQETEIEVCDGEGQLFGTYPSQCGLFPPPPKPKPTHTQRQASTSSSVGSSASSTKHVCPHCRQAFKSLDANGRLKKHTTGRVAGEMCTGEGAAPLVGDDGAAPHAFDSSELHDGGRRLCTRLTTPSGATYTDGSAARRAVAASSSGGTSLIFTYGSLLSSPPNKRNQPPPGLHNHHILDNAGAWLVAAGARTAHRYLLFDSGRNFPYAVAPDCLPRSLAKRAVQLTGEVYRVSTAVLHNQLDSLEQHPHWYKRELVPVESVVETVWMYLMQDARTIRNCESLQVVADGNWARHAIERA